MKQHHESSCPALIPLPRRVEWTEESFPINGVALSHSPELKNEASFLRNIIDSNGAEIGAGGDGEIRLILLDTDDELNHEEAYRLNVSENGVLIEALQPEGIFRGVQTLRQLIEDGEAAGCRIVDWPAFDIRGFMHDVGRNFQSIEFLKEQLEIASHYKFNVFHWHLTDHPAWRIECRVHPELNDPDNHRPGRDPGKYYSYDEIRDLIAFCAERHILVIPEIDMPGHSQYFTKAMGFDMGSEQGMAVLEECLEEFFEEIPVDLAPIFHLGSDEIHIPDPEGFISRLTNFVRDNGRETIVWNPGLNPDAGVIRQCWNHNKTDGPWRYIDSVGYYVTDFEPLSGIAGVFFKQMASVPEGHGTRALGGILCIWNDIRLAQERDVIRLNPVYPAFLAFAERSWRGADEDRPEYRAALPPVGSEAHALFVEFEERLLSHRDKYLAEEPFPYVKQSDIAWRVIGPFDHGGDINKTFPPEREVLERYEFEGESYTWDETVGGTVTLSRPKGGGLHQDGPKGTAYALTYIHSEDDREVFFRINFETPRRPNRQYGGVPPAGKWCPFGGNIWLNDEAIPAPRWDSPGEYNFIERATWFTPLSEEPWTYEELYWTRPPVKVTLKRGWNKILAKIPCGYPQQIWVFTCVPGQWDGSRFTETEGLKFSTIKPE